MTDVVKMCDVIDNCTECPRYGDDCDGDKRLYTHEEAWGMSDYIRRADAIDAIIAEGRTVDSRYLESERIVHECDAVEALAMLPSARPTGETLQNLAKPNKRGVWMLRDGYYCSNCNYKCQTTGLPAVCPNCDADMRGGDTE